MMKSIRIFPTLLIVAGITISCQNNGPKPEPTPKTIDLTPRAAEVITSNNDFGIKLFTSTAAGEDDNMMLSPLSAGVALTMLLNGCDSETYSQIRDMLGYPQNMTIQEINSAYQSLVKQLLEADPKVKLAIANAIFYRSGFSFKAPFLNTMATDFDATVDGLDFDNPAAVNTINQWASDNTNKRIPKVIDRISAETVMFLMNALYFKGDWTYQFDKANTSERYFMLDNGTEIQTPTMDGKVKVNLHYGDGFSAMELPYGRKNFSMVILMPDGKLKDFYPDFTPQLWDEITTSLLGGNWTEILVNLPKFKFEYEKILNDQLKALGMEDAFVPYVADLSGISDEELFVSFVKQNTFVEVNEEGTEAAAVTTIGIDVVSMPPHFFVNKPFIFAIRERTTNTLMFIGAVTNPSN
jgi:serpin B